MKIKFINMLERLSTIHLYDEINNVEDSRYIVDSLYSVAMQAKITREGSLIDYLTPKGLRVTLNRLSVMSSPVVYFNEETSEFILSSLKLFELDFLNDSSFTLPVKADLLNYYAGPNSVRQNYHQLSNNNKIQAVIYKVFFQYFNEVLSENTRKEIIKMYEIMEDKYKL